MVRAIRLVFVVLTLLPSVAAAQGNPLGPEFRVNTFTTGHQSHPSIAADSAGNFVVVWVGGNQDGSSFGVFGQRFASAGAPLGPEFRVNTYTTGPQIGGPVAVDSSGNFVVVWNSEDQDGSSSGVFGQRYSSAGTPAGPEFRVNTYTPGLQGVSSVAADSTGNFVVVWTSEDQDGSFEGVFGQRYSSSGTPVGPEFRVNTYTTGSQFAGPVASDASGNFVVVWRSYIQDGIFGQRYASSGSPLGSEFQVNTSTTTYQRVSGVAADSVGNFVVVWQNGSWMGPEGELFARRYTSAGTPLGPEFQINTYTTGYQRSPSVAADSSGNFVIVWDSDYVWPQSSDIVGQRYASSGTPLGPQFRVNTNTTIGQTTPGVAADSAGNFVVVWTSQLQDGSNDGVFGQRYGQIVPVELMQLGVE